MSIQAIYEEAAAQIVGASSVDQLKEVQVAFLGKKGKLTEIFKTFRDLSPEERKASGAEANQVKSQLTELITERTEELEESGSKAYLDVTLPGTRSHRGGEHPILSMMAQLNEAFHSMGFEVFEGPEVSSEAYDFDSLNFPPEHPARESMDTYWLEGYDTNSGSNRLCLRPHLTGGSIRYMQTHKPPFRFVYPGRVFRNESTDASHERAFFQYEALIVDKQVPFSAVRLLVNAILERVFGREVVTRMRAGFFPFVEPGFEIDMQCLVCEGKGCSVCGQVGWIELMPGGPPHPNVFKSGGIDPEQWQGAYINIGLDRLVMMKYGINDVRLFHSGDLRFLQQFS
ncbi:MAG: phenylalanine--tRNA ligase subunit alpha [Bdellovibrionales bacterium]|nr:phenylalanine--tRNA ligase subunit alpha [Bdellovibrionales bacterium]